MFRRWNLCIYIFLMIQLCVHAVLIMREIVLLWSRSAVCWFFFRVVSCVAFRLLSHLRFTPIQLTFMQHYRSLRFSTSQINNDDHYQLFCNFSYDFSPVGRWLWSWTRACPQLNTRFINQRISISSLVFCESFI